MKIEIKSIGFDSWNREVFQTKKGSLLCDINLDYSHENMRLYSKVNNEFDDEPNIPLKTERFIIVDEFTND